MPKTIRLALLIGISTIAAIAIAISGGAQAADNRIDVLHVDGTITPVSANYIDRGINQAEQDGAVACIIELDTPGGLMESMHQIIKAIQSSNVPVAVYVAPSGSRAGSPSCGQARRTRPG